MGFYSANTPEQKRVKQLTGDININDMFKNECNTRGIPIYNAYNIQKRLYHEVEQEMLKGQDAVDARLMELLEEKGLCTSQEFIDACQTYDEWLDLTQYPFLSDLQNAENVCFYLEGYFFPLTYDIPETATAQDIVKMFLNGTKQKFNDMFMLSVNESRFNLHELLTLASLIEKEAFLDEQRTMISSVLHNRLDKKMKFQCDPTVKYCTGVIEVVFPEKLDHFKYYYNTYRCDGLMAGPICNPGMASIEAALNPADTEYLYFIVGTVEPYEAKYSKTYSEHSKFWNANKDRLTGKG